MDEPKEPKVNLQQIREELDIAKARVTERAESLSFKEYMVEHPYVTLGAAFLSGVVLGGSHETRESLAKAVVDIISSELTYHRDGR
jgi:hypothetical protein